MPVLAQIDYSNTEFVALQINPDKSVTVISKGISDMVMAYPPKGAFEEIRFKPEDKRKERWEQENRHRNILDDHAYDYTEYKGIKNGKALFERTQGHRGPGGRNSYKNTDHFEIAPFTLIDYANSKAKEEEVWYGIAHMENPTHSQFVRQFIANWVKIHGEEALVDISKKLGKKIEKKTLIQWQKCEANPDTEFVGDRCVQKCSPDSFRGSDYSCYSCVDSRQPYVRDSADCSRCPNRSAKLETPGIYFCALTDCPKGYFPTIDNPDSNVLQGCISCDHPMEFYSSNCTQCPNRKYKDGRCSLKQ